MGGIILLNFVLICKLIQILYRHHSCEKLEEEGREDEDACIERERENKIGRDFAAESKRSKSSSKDIEDREDLDK